MLIYKEIFVDQTFLHKGNASKLDWIKKIVGLVSKRAQSVQKDIKVNLSEAAMFFHTVLLALDRVTQYNLHSELNRRLRPD